MTTAEKLIKNKLGLLQLASYLQNVSEACRVMGYSRDTFYQTIYVIILIGFIKTLCAILLQLL